MPKFYKSSKKIKKKNIKSSKKIQKKVQLGGAFPFKNTISLTVMSGVTGDSLDRVNERRDRLGLKPKDNLHITLLKMLINKESIVMMGGSLPVKSMSVVDIANMKLQPLLAAICRSYADVYLKNQLVFTSQKLDIRGKVIGGAWEILGGRYGRNAKDKFNSKYFARVFKPPADAQHFRKELWNYMENAYGSSSKHVNIEQRGRKGDFEEFKIFIHKNGEELYALDNFNHSFAMWKPHISILQFGELEVKRPHVYQDLLAVESNTMNSEKMKEDLQIEILKNAIGPVKPMSKINSSVDLHNPFIGLNSHGDTVTIPCEDDPEVEWVFI